MSILGFLANTFDLMIIYWLSLNLKMNLINACSFRFRMLKLFYRKTLPKRLCNDMSKFYMTLPHQF